MAGGKKKAPAHHTNASYGNFFADLLTQIGLGTIPNAQRVIDEQALAAVAHFEGLNTRYNPLNSVVPYGTSTAFNSVGVQDYKNYEQGIYGSALLLAGPNHSSIWDPVDAALAHGSQTDIIAAFDRAYQTWGSSGPVALSKQDANTIITGSIGKGTSNPLPNVMSNGDVLKGAVGQTASDIAGAVTAPFDILKSLYSDVTSVDWWIRVGFIILGLLVLLVAVDKLTDGGITGASGGSAPQTIDVVTSKATGAAQATAQGAANAGKATKKQVQRHAYQPTHKATQDKPKGHGAATAAKAAEVAP